MIPFPMAAADKLQARTKELWDIAWTCRVLDRHKHPAEGSLTDLCDECGKRVKKVIDQAKDDMIAEGTKLLAKLASTGRD